MAVLVISDLPGGTIAESGRWDRMMTVLRRQPGLLVHADGPTDHGWRFVSIWDTREDFERFFDATIRPNLPPGAPARDAVSELRQVLLREGHQKSMEATS